MNDDNARTDRRVRRTRQLLRDALMALILEKGYDSVTVQDITDRANLGRATFYLHYRDKEELLTRSVEAIYESLTEHIEPLSRDLMITQRKLPLEAVFRHAAENRDLYRVIVRGQGTNAVVMRIRGLIAANIQCQFESWSLAAESKMTLEVISHFIAGSLLAMMTWWLEHNMPYTPDEMSDLFSALVMPGVIAQIQPPAS